MELQNVLDDAAFNRNSDNVLVIVLSPRVALALMHYSQRCPQDLRLNLIGFPRRTGRCMLMQRPQLMAISTLDRKAK
jgi:hypothetical protein